MCLSAVILAALIIGCGGEESELGHLSTEGSSGLSYQDEVRGTPTRAETDGFRAPCRDLGPYLGMPPIVPPEVLKRVAPELPPQAVQLMRLEGTVIVEALIDSDGKVCDVRLLKGLFSHHPEYFDLPAIAAVRSWRFSPARLQGRPVSVVHPVIIRIGF